MPETQRTTDNSAPEALQPPLGALDLIQGEAAGCCGGTACGVSEAPQQ